MNGKCQLCHKAKYLQKRNHIYPRFVINRNGNKFHHLTKNGRFGTKQDFYAHYLFCRDCENNIFNRWGEKPVADGYSFPGSMKDVPEKALEHFALSVLYRAAIYKHSALHESDSKALECWRQRILARRSAEACHPIMCVPTFDCPSHPIATVLNKTFNMAMVKESEYRLVWVNMPGFLMAGFLSFPRPSTAERLKQIFNDVGKSQAIRLNSEVKELTLKRE